MAKLRIILCFVVCFLFINETQAAWFLSGENAREYRKGIDTEVFLEGGESMFLESKHDKVEEWATVMQYLKISPKYRGKRLRFRVALKTEQVEGWAGAWFRVDKGMGNSQSVRRHNTFPSQGFMLAFDNMHDRPLKGSLDWDYYSLVLDVPKNAKLIGYGALLVGAGKVWFDDASLQVVDESVPVTGQSDK